ncbi:MAG: hypothetical protein M1828_006451 [Chrysothrix sp. TS-e1954]|nr:MAG: hypothetical protein M1828_006451 [Chrysothrix sp. TS-e1954]
MANQPTKPKQGSKWGSLLSGAVAGLESRLDTILAEEGTAAARNAQVAERARSATEAQRSGSPGASRPSTDVSRSTSIKRTNARLQSSPVQNRAQTASPAAVASKPRTSTDSTRSQPGHADDVGQVRKVNGIIDESEGTSGRSTPAINEVGRSDQVAPIAESVENQLLEQGHGAESPPTGEPDEDPHTHPGAVENATQEELQGELAQAREDLSKVEAQRQEEMHEYLERIDGLQEKLQYVVQEVLSSVKQIASEAPSGSLQKKVAEQDEKIILLMEEGQKLSKTEVAQTSTVRNLRAKMAEESRTHIDTKHRLAKAERSSKDYVARVSRLEAEKKESSSRLSRIPRIQQEVSDLKESHEAKDAKIEDLSRSLREASHKVNEDLHRVNAQALEDEKRRVQDLEDELDATKRAHSESDEHVRKAQAELQDHIEQERERSRATETTLRNEMSVLEGRLELMRERTEEASSGSSGDSQAKLMRQIETLQVQYSVASDNWQGIESSLQSRLAALEKERGEIARQETEARRKVRELGTSSRRLQDKLDETSHRCQVMDQELTEHKSRADRLSRRVSEYEKELTSIKSNFERERQNWNMTLTSKIEEERTKWQQETRTPLAMNNSIAAASSPQTSNRKQSNLDLPSLNTRRQLHRQGSELNIGQMQRPHSRRSSAVPFRAVEAVSPSGNESGRSTPFLNHFNAPPETPSIYTADHDEVEVGSSPHRTVNEMLSGSTAGAGPSVQLVERMSASVRRLESEKAASREELSRIQDQRDEARKEIVSLMREIEQRRSADDKAVKLETEVSQLTQRYQTTLEMLGEKSERVEELEADVTDVKKIYKELIDSTMK